MRQRFRRLWYRWIGSAFVTGVVVLLRSREQDCLLIYPPTAPIPMIRGLMFVPASTVTKLAMSVDDPMKLYFSLGTLSSQVMPDQYRTSKAATGVRLEASSSASLLLPRPTLVDVDMLLCSL